jgi:hypothetical protein
MESVNLQSLKGLTQFESHLSVIPINQNKRLA